MLKLAGALLLVAASSYVGLMISQRLKDRILILRQLSHMVDAIALKIRWEGAAINEIAVQLKDNPSLDRLTFLTNLSANVGRSEHPTPFDALWSESVRGWNAPLNASDRRMLLNISDGLGTSDIEGQLSWQNRCRAEIAYACEHAEAEYTRKAKLYRTLGVIGGAFAAIVLY